MLIGQWFATSKFFYFSKIICCNKCVIDQIDFQLVCIISYYYYLIFAIQIESSESVSNFENFTLLIYRKKHDLFLIW